MPRFLSFADELDRLKDKLEENPQATRQYVTRVPIPTAVAFIQECLARNTQPGRLLQEVLIDRYNTAADGVNMTLPAPVRESLDAAAECYGTDRETALLDLLSEFLVPYLQKARQAKRDQEALTREITGGTPEAPTPMPHKAPDPAPDPDPPEEEFEDPYIGGAFTATSFTSGFPNVTPRPLPIPPRRGKK